LPNTHLQPEPADLARLSLRLLQEGADWIARRKEIVRILDEKTLRRQETVDVSLTALTASGWKTNRGDPVYFAPLFFLRKMPHQFFNFDLKSDAGGSLTLPTRAENAAVSSELLRQAAKATLRERGVSVTSQTSSGLDIASDELLRDIVETPQYADAEDLAASVYEAIARTDSPLHAAALSAPDARFDWLLRLLSKSSAVVIRIVGDDRARRIFKLSYDEQVVDVADSPGERLTQRLGWDGIPIVIDLPYIGSQNFHFQAEAPKGMQIVAAGLVDRTPAPAGEIYDDADFTRNVHLYLPGTELNRGALAWLLVRLRGEGFVSGAFLVATLVALVLSGFALFTGPIAQNPTSTPALLLALTAILASYVGRPGGHALTARLLSNVRWLVLSSAGLAYAAAGAVAIWPRSVGVLRPLFIVLATGAWAIVLLLRYSRMLPRRAGDPDSWDERLMRRLLGDRPEEPDPPTRP
jgi:hypothetical protein